MHERSIQKIPEAEAIKSCTQPVRVRMDMTEPVGVKRRLQKASTKYGVDMTRIMVALLDEKLHELLSGFVRSRGRLVYVSLLAYRAQWCRNKDRVGPVDPDKVGDGDRIQVLR